MLICQTERPFRLTVLLTMLLASCSIVFADRRFCGAGLADILKMMCEGKYRARDSSPGLVGERRIRAAAESGGIIAECCAQACSLKTLMSYCAAPASGVPGIPEFIPGFSGMNSPQTSSSLKNPANNLIPSAQPSSYDDSRTQSAPGPKGGRRQSLKQTFDVSGLLDTRLDDGESLPTRERRRR